METTTIRQAERSEFARAARSLARTFYDDPVVGHVWPNDAKRLRRSELSFAASMRALRNRREVHVDEEFETVAVWARPDEWEIPPTALVRVLPTWLWARVGLGSLLAYLRTDALHPDEPHWYLEFLGTVPQRQGKGLGGRVLEPVLKQADEAGVPVWAWSSNRLNLAFYHRHGFVVLDEIPFVAGGPPIFPIRREPRA